MYSLWKENGSCSSSRKGFQHWLREQKNEQRKDPGLDNNAAATIRRPMAREVCESCYTAEENRNHAGFGTNSNSEFSKYLWNCY